MGLTGISLIVTLACLILALNVAVISHSWRSHRRWGSALLTSAMLVGSHVGVVALAGIAVNDLFVFFPDWNSLLGVNRATHSQSREVGSLEAAAMTALSLQQPGSGAFLPDAVRDPITGLSTPMSVYVPAAYATAGRNTRFSVIELLHGYPGSIKSWTSSMNIGAVLDREISTGRMPPVIVVIPNTIVAPPRDTECVDVPRGPQVEKLLTVDLRQTIIRQLRVSNTPKSWAALGYSTGAYCAVNLALHHPSMFGVAASMSGYFSAVRDRTTGDLYQSAARRDFESPIWFVQHHPSEARGLSVLLALGGQEPEAKKQVQNFAAVIPAGMHVQTAALFSGGHSFRMWRILLPKCLEWIGSQLQAPQLPVDGTAPVPARTATGRSPFIGPVTRQ